jgi:hypothetical protein
MQELLKLQLLVHIIGAIQKTSFWGLVQEGFFEQLTCDACRRPPSVSFILAQRSLQQ